MANKIVSLIILVIGIAIGGATMHPIGWGIFFIAALVAFVNLKKNIFKL